MPQATIFGPIILTTQNARADRVIAAERRAMAHRPARLRPLRSDKGWSHPNTLRLCVGNPAGDFAGVAAEGVGGCGPDEAGPSRRLCEALGGPRFVAAEGVGVAARTTPGPPERCAKPWEGRASSRPKVSGVAARTTPGPPERCAKPWEGRASSRPKVSGVAARTTPGPPERCAKPWEGRASSRPQPRAA